MGKIITIENLLKNISKNKKIVTTNGAFDLFHVGHLRTLKFAKSKGDILVVLLNTDKSIKKYKSKKRPIIPERERAEILSAIKYVDYVVLFNEKTPIKALKKIKPQIHIKGSEYKENLLEKEIIEKNGGKVIFIKRTPISTTKIIEKILKIYR